MPLSQVLLPPLLPYPILLARLCLLFSPFSLSLPIYSFPILSLQLPLSSQYYFQVMVTPLSFSYYLNTSMGAMKYKKNNPSNHFLCLATEHLSVVTAEKISPSLQVQSGDHHWNMCHQPSWKSSEEKEHAHFVARVSREFS